MHASGAPDGFGGRRLGKKSERFFKNGEFIFREGDPSDAAYVVVDGKVELVKDGEDGPLSLALVSKGDMFGEMGVLDQSARSASARAVGDARLRVIPRAEFMRTLKKQPDMAMSVMGKLVERLRKTNDQLAEGGGVPAVMPVGGPGPTQDGVQPHPARSPRNRRRGKAAPRAGEAPTGLWSGLLARIFGRVVTHDLEIRVAPIIDRNGEDVSGVVVAALDKRKGLKVRAVGKKVELPAAQTSNQLIQAMIVTGRRWLVEQDADLLIWGDVPPPGTTLHLRFVPAKPEDEDRPGYFGCHVSLTIPVEFTPATAQLLLAVCVATMVPRDEARARKLHQILPQALEAHMAALNNLPPDMTSRERAVARLFYANLASIVATQWSSRDFVGLAVDAYRECLRHFDQRSMPLEWANAQRNRGVLLQLKADRGGPTELLDEATDCYLAALREIGRDEFPRQWAATKNRLGWVLYRIAMDKGDTDLLKQAIAAYQDAIHVFTRTEAPMRWAEVMNNFAQAVQLLGEHLRNEELLEKAIDACRAVLEVRRKKDAPLPWAATQNNLGSALFMLGQRREDPVLLREAGMVFAQAQAVYQGHGHTKAAAVAERNLHRVERLLEEQGLSLTPDPDDKKEARAGAEGASSTAGPTSPPTRDESTS